MSLLCQECKRPQVSAYSWSLMDTPEQVRCCSGDNCPPADRNKILDEVIAAITEHNRDGRNGWEGWNDEYIELVEGLKRR